MKIFLSAVAFLIGLLAAVLVYYALELHSTLTPATALSVATRYISALPTPFGRVKLRTQTTADGLHIAARCVQCRVENSRLAPTPLTTTKARLEGNYRDHRFQGKLFFEDLVVTIESTWSGAAAAGAFVLPETSIAQIIRALRTIIPEAERVRITGTVSGAGSFEWPDFTVFFRPRIKNFRVEGLVDKDRYARGRFPYLGKDAAGKTVTIVSGEGSDRWLSLAGIGQTLPNAVIASEDGSFYAHPGYDLSSILEVMAEHRTGKKRPRGASTLTQQLVKNLFLDNERTYARKVRELLYAVEIDRLLGKKRVLELYLNVVEWGPGIYGAKDAAQLYFGKPPAELQLHQAAWLASILRSPKKAWTNQYLTNKPRRHLMEIVLQRMKKKGIISDDEYNQAVAGEIVFAAKREGN